MVQLHRSSCCRSVCVHICGLRECADVSSNTSRLGLFASLSAGCEIVRAVSFTLYRTPARFWPMHSSFFLQLVSRLPAWSWILSSVSDSRLAFSKGSHPPVPARQLRVDCTSGLRPPSTHELCSRSLCPGRKVDRSAAQVVPQCAS